MSGMRVQNERTIEIGAARLPAGESTSQGAETGKSSSALASETEKRAQVIKICQAWIGTPYRLGARVKGVGCDCFTFIAAVFEEAGIIEREALPVYHHDWWATHSEQNYLLRLRRFATQVFEGIAYQNTPMLPGNILCVRQAHGRAFWHGGIVGEKFPMVFHCMGEGVREIDATKHASWALHKIIAFDPFQVKL